jgi:hypothetical protein
MLYNFYRSQSAETIGLAPKAPFLATPAQLKGFESQWNLAHKKNYPFLYYNPDPKVDGPPQRQFPNQLHTGIQQEVVIADQELHDTTGLQQASMGERSNEKSGIAIAERRRQGDRGQITYVDNLARSMKYAGKVLVDLIPKIYDTPRMVRIQMEDGETDFVQVNAEWERKGKPVKYDLTVGKYDVLVSVGPGYVTQRLEAADSMERFIKAYPPAAPILGDLFAKNLDWPGADEIAERLRKLMPPGIVESEEDEGDGLPPAGPPQPDPMQMLALEQEKEKLKQEQLKTMKLQAEIQKIQVQTQKEAAEFAFESETTQ